MAEITEQLMEAVRQAIKDNAGREYDNLHYQAGLSATRDENGEWDVALFAEPMNMIVVSSDDMRNCPAEEIARTIAECWDNDWND